MHDRAGDLPRHHGLAGRRKGIGRGRRPFRAGHDLAAQGQGQVRLGHARANVIEFDPRALGGVDAAAITGGHGVKAHLRNAGLVEQGVDPTPDAPPALQDHDALALLLQEPRRVQSGHARAQHDDVEGLCGASRARHSRRGGDQAAGEKRADVATGDVHPVIPCSKSLRAYPIHGFSGASTDGRTITANRTGIAAQFVRSAGAHQTTLVTGSRHGPRRGSSF